MPGRRDVVSGLFANTFFILSTGDECLFDTLANVTIRDEFDERPKSSKISV